MLSGDAGVLIRILSECGESAQGGQIWRGSGVQGEKNSAGASARQPA